MLDKDCFKCRSDLVIHCDNCNHIPDYCSCEIDKSRKDIDSDNNISEGMKSITTDL